MTLTQKLIDGQIASSKIYLASILLYGAVGTSVTTPVVGDTALGAEVLRKSRSDVDSSVSNQVTVSLIIETTEANGSTIGEDGWFDAPTTGNMYVRDTPTTINKTSDIQLYLDTTVTITVEEI